MKGSSQLLNSRVSLWLHLLSKSKLQLVPVYTREFQNLHQIAPIHPEKVVRNNDGEPRIFYVNRDKTIKVLKDLYRFHSKEDATKVIKDVDI